MNATQYEYSDDEIEAFIDEIEPPVTVLGMKFNASRILKELDPIAFNMVSDDMPERWKCSECGELHDSEDEANECCVELVECPICGYVHDTVEAANCCTCERSKNSK